jgi:hypothetical protein
MKRALTVSSVGLLLLVGLTGCSGFNSEFNQTLASMPPAYNTIEGPWEGRWQSQSGHGGGKLRAIMTKTGPETYVARFRAGYWGIFESDQETLFRVTGTGPYKATGESDLGALKGGTYRYEATITPEKFDATYKSEDDHGIFTLERPKPRS